MVKKIRVSDEISNSDAPVLYGTITYWLTRVVTAICLVGLPLAMARVDQNYLNPHRLFAAIWEGRGVVEVWQEVGDGFPGGHFYINHLFSGDALTQLAIVLGCSISLAALMAASWQYFKEKSYGYSATCLLVSAVIVIAMLDLM